MSEMKCKHCTYEVEKLFQDGGKKNNFTRSDINRQSSADSATLHTNVECARHPSSSECPKVAIVDS